jgi:hypothetical protein
MTGVSSNLCRSGKRELAPMGILEVSGFQEPCSMLSYVTSHKISPGALGGGYFLPRYMDKILWQGALCGAVWLLCSFLSG